MSKVQMFAVGGAVVVAVVALAAQLIRPNEVNPPEDPAATITAKLAPPKEVADLLFASCGDCHSNRTTWPWYANITPVNFWIAGHVTEGRDELNLSDWAFNDDDTRRKLGHLEEEVREGGMPPGYYSPMHANNRLTDAQRTLIADWAKAEMDRRGGPLPDND